MIDLHTHSTASDGTQSPTDLVRAAAEAGVHTLALTDHDTTAGWAEAARAAEDAGIQFVPGIELSCVRGGVSVHLLGYLFSGTDPGLLSELERTRASRDTRLARMVRRLADDGLPLTLADVEKFIPAGATVGRPHLADAMVARGIVRDRGEAFARYLHNDSPYYIAHYAPDPVAAVRVIAQAGGVPIAAHPLAVKRGMSVPMDLLEEMVEAGLAGLEAHHREHDDDAVCRLRALAERGGLLVTGGSDYHGSGKPNRLGERTTEPATLAEIVARAG